MLFGLSHTPPLPPPSAPVPALFGPAEEGPPVDADRSEPFTVAEPVPEVAAAVGAE